MTHRSNFLGTFAEFLELPVIHDASVSASEPSYLTDSSVWWKCPDPKDMVQFHIGLFSTLLATSGLQLILCATQMINGLFGCLCGTCIEKGVR